MAQLRSVTCHTGSHSVTCHPTPVNTPRLNPSHAGRYSIYLPRRDVRLSWPSWLDSAPAGSRTSDLSITSPTLNQWNHQDNHWYDMICLYMSKCLWYLCLSVCLSVCVYWCRVLHVSCQRGLVAVVRLLISKHVDIFALDDKGNLFIY